VSALVVERPEGTSFRVTLLRAAGRPDATPAPVLLLQPAMGMKSRYYTRLAEALAAAGVHAAVSELRGHEAEGGRPPGRDYDFGYADMVDDVAAAVDAVEKELPESPVVLLGHSMGGQLAVAYAATHPGRIAGLAMVGSSTPHWRHYRRAFLPLSQAFGLVARAVGHFPGERVGFAGREARTMMTDWARFARTGRLPVGEDCLAEVDLPVLAVTVAKDSYAPGRAVRALVEKLPAARVTEERIEGEGIDHFRWAKNPDSVVPLITDWLAGAGLA